jgi:curli production assembly/transport component CsgG
MKKLILSLLVLLTLSGCAHIHMENSKEEPVALLPRESLTTKIPELDGPPIAIAVYGFQDKTGQRRNTPNIASFSTAVTQGAEPFLIKALQDVGKGQWFDVVERVNVDNLIKERTIIKQMRDAYEGNNAKTVPPLQFAGIIVEGGIIGYDSGMESGGAAYKWLGIGPQSQYSKDIVTVSLRAISVSSGRVLTTITVSKTIYSTADSIAVLKAFRGGTAFFEAETGLTINEPTTLAVKATVEAAVVELINEGERKGIWSFKPTPENLDDWYENSSRSNKTTSKNEGKNESK